MDDFIYNRKETSTMEYADFPSSPIDVLKLMIAVLKVYEANERSKIGIASEPRNLICGRIEGVKFAIDVLDDQLSELE